MSVVKERQGLQGLASSMVKVKLQTTKRFVGEYKKK